MKEDIIAVRYKELACAVLHNAAEDYLKARKDGYCGYGQLNKIDNMWFVITDINKEYFINELIKKGDRKYGKRVSKRSTI